MAETFESTEQDGLFRRLAAVEERISRACAEAGRSRDSVTLVAVSKSHSARAVSAVLKAGQRHFGENRVQELLAKQADLAELDPEGARRADWQLIGSLQRNKVRKVLGTVSLIQSADRPALLAEIERVLALAETPTVQDVLLEINYSGEASKQGCPPDAALDLLAAARKLPRIRVRGLMTMAEYGLEPDSQHAFFSSVHREWTAMRRSLPEAEQAAFDILSMGMSGDFEAAIACGSTMVRIGSAIFGSREAGSYATVT